MSKPDDIPQKVWIAAGAALGSSLMDRVLVRTRIARAIMAERARASEAGYLLGFKASGEGWNGEYPFEGKDPEADQHWLEKRAAAIREGGQ